MHTPIRVLATACFCSEMKCRWQWWCEWDAVMGEVVCCVWLSRTSLQHQHSGVCQRRRRTGHGRRTHGLHGLTTTKIVDSAEVNCWSLWLLLQLLSSISANCLSCRRYYDRIAVSPEH